MISTNINILPVAIYHHHSDDRIFPKMSYKISEHSRSGNCCTVQTASYAMLYVCYVDYLSFAMK